MNLPNRLTIMRIIAIPFFIFFLMTDFVPFSKWIAFALFIIASLTDLLDGYIARKYNLVSDFGKFADPLADKLLVCSALICLLAIDRVHFIIVLVIISRDFIISGFRLVAASKGVVIAADMSGKIKTTLQMVMILMIIAQIPILYYPTLVVELIVLFLTVFSLIECLVKNRAVLKEDKK